MVKLTPELIEQSGQYTNPVRDRELDLRGYKIPVIENLGATLDQFDTIDFSDNDIRKVDGFPLLPRLKTILLNNNRVVRISDNLEECLPNLQSLVLTNNSIQELGDLDAIATNKALTSLSLMKNPVTNKKHYRLYVIHKMPHLCLLDFRKIKMKEREAATQMFKGKRGQKLVQDIGKKTKTFVPGAALPNDSRKPESTGPTKEEIDAIKLAIANASTLEEVERLTQVLRSGQVPGTNQTNGATFIPENGEMEYE